MEEVRSGAAILFCSCANGHHIWMWNSTTTTKLSSQERKALPGSPKFSCVYNGAFGRYSPPSVSFRQERAAGTIAVEMEHLS